MSEPSSDQESNRSRYQEIKRELKPSFEKRRRESTDREFEENLTLAAALKLKEELANQIDILTGALKREAFLKRVEEERQKISRKGGKIYLGLLDVNEFKKINDQYGHSVGDTALITTVRRLQQSIRPYDLVGRFGGDEFLLALLDGNNTTAEILKSRLENVEIKDEPRLGYSIGVVEIGKEDSKISIDEILKRADQAMYRAKQRSHEQGGTHLEIWTPSLPPQK